MKPKLLLLLALGLTIGCASAPKINYFTLDMEPSKATNPVVNLVVERVRTTDALSRLEIMILASPTEIEYYAADRWVGGLSDLVRQKLTAEFGPAQEGRPTLMVSVAVLACEQVDMPGGAEARMMLAVTVRDPAEKRYRAPVLETTYEASRRAIQPTAGAVVAALSVCAEEIAAKIAADVSAL